MHIAVFKSRLSLLDIVQC